MAKKRIYQVWSAKTGKMVADNLTKKAAMEKAAAMPGSAVTSTDETGYSPYLSEAIFPSKKG